MKMTGDWTLREQIYALAHSWPQYLGAFLLGCVVGWGLTFLIPSGFRAERGLLVTFTPDALYRNPDDYKNWQLDTLELLLTSPETLQVTLDHLQGKDVYWSGKTATDLQSSLHLYWRNAGEWRLVAEAPHAQLATQLADAWQDACLAVSAEALTHAREVLSLDAQLRAVAITQTEQKLRTARLTAAQNGLLAWRDEAALLSEPAPLPAQERWRLISLMSLTAQGDPAGMDLLAQAPPAEAAASEYSHWVDDALIYISTALTLGEQQLPELNAEFDRLGARWYEESGLAHGLSAYGDVKALEQSAPPAESVRPSAWAALAGGLVAVLAWLLVQGARLYTKASA